MKNNIQLFHGDCLDIMRKIPPKSIDMILCDLPYGVTQNVWDNIIPFEDLWKCYNHIIKDNGAICLFAQSPFDKILASSNINFFKYEWIIEKSKATGFLNAKKMPMKCHENLLVFYKKLPVFNPQMTDGHAPAHSYTKHTGDGSNYGSTKIGISGGGQTTRYPRDVLRFKWDTQKSKLHPTQKPVSMLEYFIKTYSNKGDVVLDNCMGSGSAGIACINTDRKFIGIEIMEDYYNLAENRIREFNAGGCDDINESVR